MTEITEKIVDEVDAASVAALLLAKLEAIHVAECSAARVFVRKA